MNRIKINGITYEVENGSSVVVSGNSVVVNGQKLGKANDPIQSIEITGSIESLQVDHCENLVVNNDKTIGRIQTVSGDISCNDVNSISTVNGDVVCNECKGSISTVNGDVRERK